MRFKKVILALITVVYTLVLVHNLTPHRHNNSQKALSSESGKLNGWFNFLFGHDHEKSVHDEGHLTNFLLSENDDCDEISIVFQSDDNPLFLSVPSEFCISGHSPIFPAQSETCFLNSASSQLHTVFAIRISGRAPPVMSII
jgi:hypothetical protein